MTEIIAVSTETANLRMMNLNHLKIETKSSKCVVYPKFPIHALPTQMIQLMEFENKKIKWNFGTQKLLPHKNVDKR